MIFFASWKCFKGFQAALYFFKLSGQFSFRWPPRRILTKNWFDKKRKLEKFWCRLEFYVSHPQVIPFSVICYFFFIVYLVKQNTWQTSLNLNFLLYKELAEKRTRVIKRHLNNSDFIQLRKEMMKLKSIKFLSFHRFF